MLGAQKFGSYRDDTTAGGFVGRVADRHLAAASDALSLALLTLGGGRPDDSRADKQRRAEQARAFLAEAVTALSRARLYLPNIRTHALPVLLNTETDLDAELSRLHQIATRLLWQNHVHLPERHAEPLPPEEEAQLAVMVRGLARHAKIDRALRHQWSLVAIGVGGTGALFGAVWVAMIAMIVAVVFGLVRVTAAPRPSPAAG